MAAVAELGSFCPMKPVEQFFTEYVRERSVFYQAELELLRPIRQRFFSTDCAYDSRQGMVEHSNAERILSVSQADGETLLETTGKHNSEKLPLRYHLRPSGDSWRIHQVEMQCPCRSAGGTPSHDCRFCGGKGWRSMGGSSSQQRT